MPKGKKNQRRGKRGSKKSRRGQKFTELVTFSLQVGSSQSLTKQLLAGLPPNRNWRPVSLVVECCSGYIPPSTSASAAYSPCAINLQLLEGSASVASSRSVVLGPQPRTVKVFYPRSQDWLSYSLESSYQFGIIEAICLGNPGNPAYVRGIIRATIRFQSEVLTPTCPSVHLHAQLDDDNLSISSHSTVHLVHIDRAENNLPLASISTESLTSRINEEYLLIDLLEKRLRLERELRSLPNRPPNQN